MDEDIDVAALDPAVRRELRSLPTGLAEAVGKHLLMSGRLIDTDPAAALQHAQAAHGLAARVACVREALAVAAYANEDYSTALREARTVRRMTGDDSWLPFMADCERGLGRSERGLDLLLAADLSRLQPPTRAEALIVLAGARRDLGQLDAALQVLDTPALHSRIQAPWLARMRLAYAELLSAAGRAADSEKWVRLAAAADPDGSTLDPQRLADLEDAEFYEVVEEADRNPDAPPGGTVAPSQSELSRDA